MNIQFGDDDKMKIITPNAKISHTELRDFIKKLFLEKGFNSYQGIAGKLVVFDRDNSISLSFERNRNGDLIIKIKGRFVSSRKIDVELVDYDVFYHVINLFDNLIDIHMWQPYFVIAAIANTTAQLSDSARKIIKEQFDLGFTAKIEFKPYGHYYDLIELKDGTHIPVPLIPKFLAKFFYKRKPHKIRTDDFFVCPECGTTSFYSQWTSGCDWCGFSSQYNEDLYQQYKKRQRKKDFLLKSGLWVFFVKNYVKTE